MECSFCIWLARNNKNWAEPDMKVKTKNSLKENQILKQVSPRITKSSSVNEKSSTVSPVGFINKGNTCYEKDNKILS